MAGGVLRVDDTLVVWKLDRPARSLKTLIATAEALEHQGVGLMSLTESIDTTTPGSMLVFHVFGAIAQFERALIRERTTARLIEACRRGRKDARVDRAHFEQGVVRTAWPPPSHRDRVGTLDAARHPSLAAGPARCRCRRRRVCRPGPTARAARPHGGDQAAARGRMPVRPTPTPGRAPRKGKHQPQLSERIPDPATRWKRVSQASRTSWRSGSWIEYAHGTALWHLGGKPIVPILWVLVRYLDGRRKPEAFLCTDTTADSRGMLDCFDQRWAMETTYEEARAHLGMETQRQWSDPAVFRTTPRLLGLYSAVTLYVQQNAQRFALSPCRAAWYPKPAPTFADALARLRRHLCFERIVVSAKTTDMTEPIAPELQGILDSVCYAPSSRSCLSLRLISRSGDMGKVEARSMARAQ